MASNLENQSSLKGPGCRILHVLPELHDNIPKLHPVWGLTGLHGQVIKEREKAQQGTFVNCSLSFWQATLARPRFFCAKGLVESGRGVRR